MAAPLWKQLQGIADRRTTAFKRAFVQAVSQASAHLARAPLEQAIRRGEWERAYRLAVEAWERSSVTWRRQIATEIEAVFTTAGALTYRRVVLRGEFSRANPLALQWAEQHVAELVRRVNDTTRAAIRTVIVRSLQGEFDVRESARLIRELGIGLTDLQAQAVLTRRFAWLAAGRSRADIARMTAAYSDTLLRSRADTIARTETINAANAGQLEAWRLAQQRGFLGTGARKQWVVTLDDRLCPYCAAMRGQTRLIDERFISPLTGASVIGPTLHPRCRCALRLIPGSVRRAA